MQREHTRRQSQPCIQGIDAVGARVGITHADNLDRSEDGLEGAGAEPAMRVQHSVVPLPDTQSGTHVSVAATLQVRLQQQALHPAAFGLLLALDLVQGEFPVDGADNQASSEENSCRE